MNAPLTQPVSEDATTAPLISLRDVRKVYTNGEVAVEVLRGISLDIHAGEFVAIMGASGSGKSTLMHILGCLDRPSTGDYHFAGRDVATLSRDELAQLRREAFGFVFQSYHLIGNASATENVEIPAIYAGAAPAERRRRARELLTRLGLGERLDHRPNQLSGGQQQRVSIARALMNGGRIILADEPTGALDSRSGAEVMALLKQLAADGHTVILITHDKEVAANAERLIEIRDGAILSDSGARRHNGEAAPQQRDGTAARTAISETGEAVRTALRALRANLFRTVLTLLGIVIGVGSVVTMLAIGEGAKQSVLSQIGQMGTNLLLVRAGGPNSRGPDNTATLMPADADAIAGLPNVQAAVPENNGSVVARFGNADTRTQVTATSPAYVTTRSWEVARGTFFDADDVRTYATVAVLGQTLANNLFTDGSDPIGHYIVLNNVPFMVIGVMEPKGATPWGQDADDAAIVPITTGSLRLLGQNFLRNITVAVENLDSIDTTQQEVHALLLERHRTEDFQVRNMAALVEAVGEAQNTMTMLLGSIAAISLLVGGIGVMNIMLVSVTERTREIGIRMATGARTGDILQQFLTEALVVSAIGGAIGVAGGVAVGMLVEALGTPVHFTAAPMLLAFGCAAATGLVFGFAPALKAARLDPVVALSSV
jgi:macrolide transport system ATP-binding/permease protein